MTDFSSIDKLMEFGLGMGVATQMMRTMNYAMSQTQVPGVSFVPSQVLQVSNRASYYVVIGEQVAGPFDEQELGRLASDGSLTESSLVWSIGMNNWKRGNEIPEVYKVILLNKKRPGL